MTDTEQPGGAVWEVSEYDWPDEWGKGLDDVVKNGHTLDDLTVLHEPPPPRETAEPAEYSGHAPETADLTPGQRATLRAKERTGRWYTARRLASSRVNDGDRASCLPFRSLSSKGIQLAGISTIDLTEALPKDDLVYLVGVAEGLSSTVYQRVRECGWEAQAICKDHPEEHGERRKVKLTCKLGAHVDCPTLTTVKLRQTELPDLDEGAAQYRSVWLDIPLDMDPSPSEWAGQFKAITQKLSDWVARASKRATYKGMVLSRGIAFHLQAATSTVQLRLLLREDAPGAGERLVWEAQEQFMGLVRADYATQSGETAILQAMEDSASTLLGMGAEQREELFTEWWFALKRVKLFQGYSALYQAVRERVKEAAPGCDLCGSDLILRPITPPSAVVPEEPLLTGAAAAGGPPGGWPRQGALTW